MFLSEMVHSLKWLSVTIQQKSGAPLHLFQAQTPYETYLGGLNAQELANLKDLQTKLGQILRFKSG